MKIHGVIVSEKLTAIRYKNKPGRHKKLNPVPFVGYPGLVHTAKEICEYIPKCKRFVEPFAGLGRISKNVISEEKILNDLSDYAFEHNKRKFKNVIITKDDFLECVKKYDSHDTIFFFDPPWSNEIYEINPLTVNTMSVKEYYKKIEEILPSLKADWFIVSDENGPAKNITGFHKLIKSKKPYLFGKYAKTHLVSNKPLKLQRQTTLM